MERQTISNGAMLNQASQVHSMELRTFWQADSWSAIQEI
jgi:hypothetical protein